MAKQTFTTGQVLTAAQMTSLQQTAMGGGAATAKTASYVLTAADAGTVVQMNAAGATTITVNTALFAAGDSVQIQNIGAGVCTVTAGTATVTTAGSLALSQWEGGNLYFTSTSACIFFDIVQTSGMTNPMTTTGDTIYSSSGSTPARLGIGSTGQVLTVAAGIPSWATPAVASSGLTFIQRSTFSGVANTGTTFDGVFSTTYDSYVIVLENCTAATGTDDPIFQFRYSGTTEASSNYFYSRSYQPWNASPTYAGSNSDTKFVLEHEMGNLNGTLFINNMGNQRPNLYGNMVNYLYQYFLTFGGNLYQTRAYTGFLWSSSSSNVSGTITVYGMAKS